MPVGFDDQQMRSVDALLERTTFDPAGVAVVCAVSGGADSLSLLALAVAAGLDVTAAHVDHGLRPESAAEADEVARAAERFGAGFVALSAQVPEGGDLEARARRHRLEALAAFAGDRPILTGHTADDQAETVLINLLRGAGPGGLSAIRPATTKPLLALRRSETVALCASLDLDPVVDPSNDDRRFVRNRIRHDVLPLLADVAERDVVPLLVRAADHSRRLVDELEREASTIDPTDTAALRAASPELARIALRAWLRSPDGHPPSTAELERAMAVARHEVAATELRGGRRLARTAGRMRIEGETCPP